MRVSFINCHEAIDINQGLSKVMGGRGGHHMAWLLTARIGGGAEPTCAPKTISTVPFP